MVKVNSIDVGADWTIQGWTLFPLESTPNQWNTFVQNAAPEQHVLVGDDRTLGVYRDGSFYSSGASVDAYEGWRLLSAVGSGGTTTFYIDTGSGRLRRRPGHLDHRGYRQQHRRRPGVGDDRPASASC